MPTSILSTSIIENDIALINLNNAFTITASVLPVCLPINEANTSFATSKVNVAGWGGTSALSSISVTVLLDSATTCPKISFPNSTMCLDSTKTVGICNTDGGAPVTWYDSVYKRAKLVGMTGNTIQGCPEQKPIRVTRVSSYLDWIRNTTGQTFCTPF